MQTLLDSGAIWLDPTFLAGHQQLYDALVCSIAWDERIRARKAASFGVPYNYSGINWPGAEFPALLAPILEQVAARVGYRPNNCLAHYYPDGSSTMGFHSDATDELVSGTGIAVISLGTPRTMTFRRQTDHCLERYLLPSGSLLCMSLQMQAEWKHGLLADEEVRGGRISLTFRRMKDERESPCLCSRTS